MAKMIGAELRFETVARLAFGRGHHARIGDDQVERLSLD